MSFTSCVRDRSCAQNVDHGPTTVSSQRFSRSFVVGSFIWFLSLLPPPDVTRITRTCTTIVCYRSVKNFLLLDKIVRFCKCGHKIDLLDPSRMFVGRSVRLSHSTFGEPRFFVRQWFFCFPISSVLKRKNTAYFLTKKNRIKCFMFFPHHGDFLSL